MLRRQGLILALKYGLGLGLLVWVIVRYWHFYPQENGEDVGLATALARPIVLPAFGAAFLLWTVSVLITFARWYVLVRAQGLPFTPAAALRLGLIGLYWSTFLPGSVGGDIIKAAFVAREQERRTVAVATVILDRVIGLCGLFWLVTLLGSFLNLVLVDGVAVSQEGHAMLRGILLIAVALSLGSLVFWFAMGFFSEPWAERMAERMERVPKIGVSLAELWRALWLYRRRGKSVALALALAVIGHCGFVATFYAAANVLEQETGIPSLKTHYLIVPLGMIIQAVVPTPGGVGGAEYGFGKLYELIGYTFTAGALAALVKRVIEWALGLLGYLVYLRMKANLPVRQAAAIAAEVQLGEPGA